MAPSPLASSLSAGLAGFETSTYCAVGGAHHAGPEFPFLDASMRAPLSPAEILMAAGAAFSFGFVGREENRVVWGVSRLFHRLAHVAAVMRLVA